MTSTETRPSTDSGARAAETTGSRRRTSRRNTAGLTGAALLAAGIGGALLGHYVWKQPDRTFNGGGTLLGSCSEYTLTKAMKDGDTLPLSVGSLVVPGNSGEVEGTVNAHMIDGSVLLTGDKADAQEFAHDTERIVTPGSTLDLHQGHQTLSLAVHQGGEVTVQKTC